VTEEKFITLGDNKIRYLEAGKSENNLVLLHGLGASANRWDPVISYLSKKFHLIIPDLIGYGYSDKPLDNYTIKFFVNFLTDFLEKTDIKKTSIVASSLGGQIAAECAIRQNSSFEKLVLVSPSGINPRLSPVMDEYMLAMIRPDKQRTLHAFKQMVGPNKEVDSKIIDDFIQRISMPNAKMAIMSTLLGLKNAENLLDRLPKISIPTLVIWGNYDSVIPFRYAKIFVSSIKGCQFIEMDGCGHTPFAEDPQKFSEAVIEFLNN